ncbi:hypothetical protein STEG23_032388, partial [Scotinomys teguina]
SSLPACGLTKDTDLFLMHLDFKIPGTQISKLLWLGDVPTGHSLDTSLMLPGSCLSLGHCVQVPTEDQACLPLMTAQDEKTTVETEEVHTEVRRTQGRSPSSQKPYNWSVDVTFPGP